MASTSGKDYQPTEEEELAAIQYELSQVIAKIEELKDRKQYLLQRKENLKENLLLKKSLHLASRSWEGNDFPWSEKLTSELKNVFKIDQFRSYQLPTINATLSKEDAILLMPTGGGKSLCYQLPALIDDGFTLVVSPLVSLMEDQVMSLNALNISAFMLTHATDKSEITTIINSMTDKKAPTKLLYVTPERMAKSKRFMNKLQKAYEMGRLSRIAIDEVHCCSQWGHDFRPDYKYLNVLRGMFKGVPILGLTATATKKIIIDVQKILQIQGCLVLKSSFNRPNLYYEVRLKPASQSEFLEEMADLVFDRYACQSGIIYTTSIKDVEETVYELRRRRIRAAEYHANLKAEERSKIHKGWMNGTYQVVVATIAFGLGIDKPNVRFVIHHSLSKSMESFYQESGRAGRDGISADCIVFYRLADVFKVSSMVFTQTTGLENLYSMVDYCLDVSSCRRSLIASHFDEGWETKNCNGMCDHCRNPCKVKQIDISGYCRTLYDIITLAGKKDTKLTAIKLMDAWFHKGPIGFRPKGGKPTFSRSTGEDIVAFLLVHSYLQEDFHYTIYSTISYFKKGPRCSEVMEPRAKIMMDTKGPKLPTSAKAELTSADVIQKKVRFDLKSPSHKGKLDGKRTKTNRDSNSECESKTNTSNNVSCSMIETEVEIKEECIYIDTDSDSDVMSCSASDKKRKNEETINDQSGLKKSKNS